MRGPRCRRRPIPAAVALARLLLAAGPAFAAPRGGLRRPDARGESAGRSNASAPGVPEALAPPDVAVPRSIVPIEELPLSVRGPHVVGRSGKRVRLFCVNWYGAQLEQLVVNGLNRQPLERIAALIADMGFNCVRLPFSLELVLGNHTLIPEPEVHLAANPALQGLDPREVLDRTVRAITDSGLLVVLNVHSSAAGWCCSQDDGEGLWWTEAWPESEWLRALAMLARRHRGNKRVAAFDLRNEVRASDLGRPTWGTGDPKTDWGAAAVRGGQAVLAENGDMLIIISALLYGMFLCDMPRWPPHLQVPELKDKTLYTTHDYPWYHFHDHARRGIAGWLTTLAFSCGVLILLVAMEFAIHWCRPNASGRLNWVLRRCRGLRCAEWELAAAALLSIVALVSLMLGEHWLLNGCSEYKLAQALISLFCAPLFGFLAFALWVRAAAACAGGAHRSLCEKLGCVEQSPKHAQAVSVPQIVQKKVDQVSLTGEACTCATAAAPGEAGAAASSPADDPGAAPPTSALSGVPRHPLTRFLLSWRCVLPAQALVALCTVLTAYHDYGTYASFARELDLRWGLPPPSAKVRLEDIPPIWVGEFGASEESEWWDYFMRYLGERQLDWAYWAVNGEKRPGEEEAYGLLEADSMTVRHSWKLEALQALIRNVSVA